MPTWLLSALSLLRGAAIGTPLRALGTGGGFGFGGASLLGGEGDGSRRRRRRRRALTASDRADIAFIAATLDKAAAKAFATQLAARQV